MVNSESPFFSYVRLTNLVALEKTLFNLFVDLARGGEEPDQPVAAAGREEGAVSERVRDPVKSCEKKKPKKN